MQKHKRVQTPTPTRQRKRMPMKTVVKRIVDKWSKSYIDGAKQGDVSSVLKLAQLQHTGTGFGRIKYNPVQGRRWIEHESTVGSKDPRILEQMRRLVVQEEQTRDKLEHLLRYQWTQGEHVAFQYNPMGNRSIFRSRADSMWHWKRDPKYNDKPADRARLEKLAAIQCARDKKKPKTLADFDNKMPRYRAYLEKFHKQRPSWEETGLYLQQGEDSISPGTQPIRSRFEQQYAVKAVLDGKLQRRLTDPIPRPIHEYIMVAGTPTPQFVDPVTQSIQFADTMKNKLKTNLEVALGGKTYTRDGQATMADTPAVPTPVGVVRRYTDVVDDEIFTYDSITRGKPAVLMESHEMINKMVRRSYWPLPDEDYGRAIRTIKKAYKRAMDKEEFGKIRMLQIEDQQEHHGVLETNYVNPHFDELNRRDLLAFEHINPYMTWDGDQWTEDDDLKFDNFSLINIGWEADRETLGSTPVDTRFPYNGIPRRSFFLSDPFQAARPWVNQNEDGTDLGEEELPLGPAQLMIQNHLGKLWFDVLPRDPYADALPSMADTRRDDGTLEGLQNRMVDPIPGTERSAENIRPGGPVKFDPTVQWKKTREIYRTKNYLTRAQYSNLYSDSVTKFDPSDQTWYVDNDALDVRNLTKTNDEAQRAKQVETLVENWMKIHQMQRTAVIQSHTNQPLPDAELTDEEERLTREARNALSGGRDTHADFALQSARVAKVKDQGIRNWNMDQLGLMEQKIQRMAPEMAEHLLKLGPDGTPIDNTDDLIKLAMTPGAITTPQDLFPNLPPVDPEQEEEEAAKVMEQAPDQQLTLPQINHPPLKAPKRHTVAELETRAKQQLAQLQSTDPVKYKSVTVEQLMALDIKSQIEPEIAMLDVPDFIEGANTGWILPLDVDLALGDDGHFAGYSALGRDAKSYQPVDRRTREMNKTPFHPADGSPMFHDANSRLMRNRKRFTDSYQEVFGDWIDGEKGPKYKLPINANGDLPESSFDMTDPDYEADDKDGNTGNMDGVSSPASQAYEKARNAHFTKKDAESDERVRQRLTEQITAMVKEYNDGTLPMPADGAESDNDEVFEQSQPFIRPLVSHYGSHHPFWNRVVPNPNVFMPGPKQSSKLVRRDRNYETSMWNDYGAGVVVEDGETTPISYRDVKLTLESHGADEFFDPSRAQPVYDDDYEQGTFDQTKTYTRQELEGLLDKGLLTITRRKDVETIQPPKVNLAPLHRM